MVAQIWGLLKSSLEKEQDPALYIEKRKLLFLLNIRYSPSLQERLAAISAISESLDIEVRGALNPLLATRRGYALALPEQANIAQLLEPEKNGFATSEAFALLVAGGDADPQPSSEGIKQALIANISEGRIAGIPIAQMEDPDRRAAAYAALAIAGLV